MKFEENFNNSEKIINETDKESKPEIENYRIVKKIYVETVGGKEIVDEMGRRLCSGNLKLHSENPINTPPHSLFGKIRGRRRSTCT